ncbi:hypothetical protein [Neisseria sp. HMSC078C12]|uniref:hypothetical protein n=1 Tax=Neisseria sp. HMSC078C12 TaxID=1715075 RepID=UPI0009F265C4|nr:hypothetical protein [Neisseria sp. HMSC078C12]
MKDLLDTEMKQAELRKVDAEIAKIIADAHKINAESVKIAQEARWYPIMIATGLISAVAATMAVVIKFL